MFIANDENELFRSSLSFLWKIEDERAGKARSWESPNQLDVK